jgi:hypothetical protein
MQKRIDLEAQRADPAADPQTREKGGLMATIAGSRDMFRALSGVNRDMRTLYQRLADQSKVILIAATGIDGKIPSSRLTDVSEQIGNLAVRLFSDGRKVFGPDGTTPLSPFAERLNYWLVWVQVQPVIHHAAMMKRRLPFDVQFWLTHTRLKEQGPLKILDDNPFAHYEPAHTWVDPKGHQLSDRIWRTGQETRLKIDAMLSDGIRSGRASVDLAKDLEKYLMPGQELRTNKPYGRDVSANAMRLARTEITRAHGAATLAASKANPFVKGVDWALSGSHGEADICDELATLSASGSRLKPAYALDAVPTFPAHPHDLCNLRSYVPADMDNIIAQIRAEMQANQRPPVTPIRVRNFLERMLGSNLFQVGRMLLKGLV